MLPPELQLLFGGVKENGNSTIWIIQHLLKQRNNLKVEMADKDLVMSKPAQGLVGGD